MSSKNKKSGNVEKKLSNLDYNVMALLAETCAKDRNVEKELRDMGIKNGQVVLDYGCGPGIYTIPAAKIVGDAGKVIAVDNHPFAMQTIKQKMNAQGLKNIEPVLSKDLSLMDDSVDVILFFQVIHFLKNPPLLLKKLHKWLKPSGYLFVNSSSWNDEKVEETVTKDNLFKLDKKLNKLFKFRKK